jgi:hypothetical protein
MGDRRRAALTVGGLLAVGAVAALAPGGAADEGIAAHLTVGTTADKATATRNREWIEYALTHTADRVIQLPPGEIVLDRAIVFRPDSGGVTLAGAGPGRTVLVNRYTPNPYVENQTLSGLGTGLGYSDRYTLTADRTGLALAPGVDILPYKPGAVVYLWRWDGYARPDRLGQCTQRRRVDRIDLAMRTVTLDAPADPRCDAAKWLDAAPIRDCREGDAAVALEAAADAAGFTPGADVLVTDGPSLANEACGEFRRVAAVDAAAGRVTLDRPLRRGYTQAALVRPRLVRGVTVRDLTLAHPVHPQAEPASLKLCADWRLERVRAAGMLDLTGCHDWLIRDCDTGGMRFNTCHDVAVTGGRHASLYGEEGCWDLDFDGLRVGPSPVNGLYFVFGCERLTVRNCRFEGATKMPLGLDGRESVVANVTVAGTRPPQSNCYLSGDGLRVTGLRSDVPVVFRSGAGQSITQVHAPVISLGWIDGPPSGGVAVGLVTKTIERRSPNWTVVPAP